MYEVPGGGKIALQQQPPGGGEVSHISIEVTGIKSFIGEVRAKGARVIEDVRREDFGEFALIVDPSGNPIFLIDTSTSQYPHD